MKFMIGTDAEIMLKKRNKFVSAIPVLGKKGAKLPFGKLFYDNVLAEFTVKPAKNSKDFIKHIQRNLKAAERYFKKKGIEIYFVSSAHYPKKELGHPMAKVFGCSPDYNAYDVCVNKVSSSASKTNLRSAGAHVHFSNKVFADPYKVIEMIKMMDLILGVPSLIIDNTPEAKERRKLYGKAGAHRQKEEYPGGEYRTISNFWIKTPELINWVYCGTAKSLGEILKGNTVSKLGFNEKKIRKIIDTGNIKRAEALCKVIKTKLNYDVLNTGEMND